MLLSRLSLAWTAVEQVNFGGALDMWMGHAKLPDATYLCPCQQQVYNTTSTSWLNSVALRLDGDCLGLWVRAQRQYYLLTS